MAHLMQYFRVRRDKTDDTGHTADAFVLRRLLVIVVVVVLLSMLGAIAGALIMLVKNNGFNPIIREEAARVAVPVLVGGLVAGLLYAALMTTFIYYRRSQWERKNRELENIANQERLARQLTDAKLKLMQAQVEPHFLFNTLASVQQLAEGQAPDAAKLASQLISFLRGGLTVLREESSTLAAEFKMIEAYLSIMQTRMNERLQFSLVLPEPLAKHPMPPAMLISLVENAIKHGLEPHPPGGRIDISARRVEAWVELRVADNGRGSLAAHNHEGVGLANIRERLSALFGEAATLDVSANTPAGFVATLRIPYQTQMSHETT